MASQRRIAAMDILLYAGSLFSLLSDEPSPAASRVDTDDLSRLSVEALVERVEPRRVFLSRDLPVGADSLPDPFGRKDRWVTNPRLIKLFPSALERKAQAIRSEAALVEMIRRGGNEAEKLLKEKLERQTSDCVAAETRIEESRRKRSFSFEEDELLRRSQNNFELLTALRRVQGKPDPITITAKVLEGRVATTGHLPTFVVSLKSADVEQIPIRLKLGSDYRLSRTPRWRFEIVNSAGQRVPVRPNPGPSNSESESVEDDLCVHGATLIIHLPMERYIRLPDPGEYNVTVLYHNILPIADIAEPGDLDNLIIFRSIPCKLTVEKAMED
jgi:hypothetical protein